jgi:MFS family permease
MRGPVDKALLKLYFATFFFVLLMAVGFPLVPQHLDITFGASVFFIGLVSGVYGFAQVFLRLPMGDLADRKGRKTSLMATFVISGLAGLFYIFGPSKWYVLVGQALFGLASGVFWVAANSYLFDRVSAENVPKATSDYALALGAGFLVGPPMGGYLADAFGFGWGLSVYLWASAAGFALVASLPEVQPDDRQAPGGGVYERAWRIFKHPDIRVSAFGTLLFGLLTGVLSGFFPVYIRGLAFTAFVVGVLIAIRQVFSLVARIGLPARIDTYGPRRVLLTGTLVGGLTLGLLPFVEHLPALAGVVPLSGDWLVLGGLSLLAVVAGLGMGVMVPSNLTLVSRGSPENEKGLANGIYGTALGLGNGVASWILGSLGEAWGIRWIFWISGIAVAFFIVLIVFYARSHPSPAEDEEEEP